jgi:hypothetical protein
MFDTIFGFEVPMAARFFIAFVVVLALIALAAWLVRRFAANRLGGGAARGRQPRLAVVDAASVDGRRRLVLIRRDNIEHLLMIGGPGDVVIEQNIVRAATREVSREPARPAAPGETLPRAVPLADAGAWPLQPDAPMSNAPAPRSSARPLATDEPWVAPDVVAPAARPRAPDDFVPPHDLGARPSEPRATPPRPVPPVVPPAAVTTPTPMTRPVPPQAPVTAPVAAPVVAPVTRDTPPAEASAPSGDHNLADMAQMLEAALRRPGGDVPRPPVTDPLAAALNTPPKPPEPPRSAHPPAPRDMKAPPAEPAPAAKPNYDSLEQEMASLLGRSTGKT